MQLLFRIAFPLNRVNKQQVRKKFNKQKAGLSVTIQSTSTENYYS